MDNKEPYNPTISLISSDSTLLGRIQKIAGQYGRTTVQREGSDICDTDPDITIIDLETEGAVRNVREAAKNSLLITLTRDRGSRYMIESMTFGAYDCISIPVEEDNLKRSLEKAVGIKTEISREAVEYSESVQGSGVTCAIVGNSPMLQEVCKLIGQMGRVDVPVLITGESGTGKDLVAESIWNVSTRWEKPFITINCAAIPEHLLEAELFGYEKGAFTGATSERIGKFEEADSGVIFMDEIGDMSLSLQAKVLRVLQNGSFHRLGGNRDIKVNVRLIAATNKDLKQLVNTGKFREDLYFRINVVNMNLPPLRERKQDIPMLAECFTRRYSSQMNKEIRGVTKSFIDILIGHDWPGNVRELENTIRKSIAFTKSYYLTSYDIDLDGNASDLTYNPLNFNSVIKSKVRNMMNDRTSDNIYKDILGDTEAILIEEALEVSKGNKSLASRMLGINRLTLIKKLKDYGMTDS